MWKSPIIRLFFSERLACGWSLENLLTWPGFVAIAENHHHFRWPLPTTFPPWEVCPFHQNEGLGSTGILSFCKRFFFCTRNELFAIHIRCCRCWSCVMGCKRMRHCRAVKRDWERVCACTKKAWKTLTPSVLFRNLSSRAQLNPPSLQQTDSRRLQERDS